MSFLRRITKRPASWRLHLTLAALAAVVLLAWVRSTTPVADESPDLGRRAIPLTSFPPSLPEPGARSAVPAAPLFDEDMPGAEDGETEADHYHGFLAAYSRDASSFERLASGILEGERPDNERAAFLRAAYETRAPETSELFVRALQSLPDEPRTQGVSVPAFGVRFLAQRAGQDPLAWTTLRDAVWGGKGKMPPRLRCVAAARLIGASPEPRLRELTGLMESESSPAVVASMQTALHSRVDSATARDYLKRRGLVLLSSNDSSSLEEE